MRRRFWSWAQQSPLVIVPAFAVFLGLVFVPFAVAGTEKAAEFYGAFAAAIVAAVAVLGTTSYQAHLTRLRDDEIQLNQLIKNATQLYIWLDSCAQRMERAAYRLEGIAKLLRDGQEPALSLTYGNYRVFLSPVSKTEAQKYWSLAHEFPVQVAQTVSHAIAMWTDDFDARNPKVIRDEQTLGEKEFEFWAQTFRDTIALIVIAQSHLSAAIRNRGVPFVVPNGLAQATKRAQELAQEVL